MKILNLYAGIGGNRKLWGDQHDITAVEYEPEVAAWYQKEYPNDTVIVGDAHQYLLDHYKEYDFIWASPPCPTHSKLEIANNRGTTNYPDMKLYQEILLLMHRFKGVYVVENVVPYYTPLIPAQQSGRHLYWANFRIGENSVGVPTGGLAAATVAQLEDFLGITLNGELLRLKHYKGHDDRRKSLRNCVHPKQGLYILNCAQNIITKQNQHQTQLF